MNLKEFDAKQFLLEKGERVGLSIAVALMVLMLIFSLFMPKSGFFSGSPVKNAEALETGTKQLESALASAKPSDTDKPGTTAGKLIKLETDLLKLDNYALDPWFQATRSESPSRRPPVIKNIDEALVWAGPVPIDTYLFVGRDYSKMVILKDADRKGGGGNKSGGANNPYAKYYGKSGGMSPPGMPGGGVGNKMTGQQRRQFSNLGGRDIQGGEEKPEYDTGTIPVANIDSSTHLARQLRPLRMALIVGSFPFKAQLEEFKNKLRKDSIQDVLNETIDEGKEKQYAFRFLGVDVQRMEVDANGKTISDPPWGDLDLNGSYMLWMKHSGLPFEPDDAKLDPIKPISIGLMMPRLRQFREESPQENLMAAMGPRGPMGPGGPRGPREAAPAPREGDSKYPDIEAKLKGVGSTLEKLSTVAPKQIAVPPSKFRTDNLNVFNPEQVGADDANSGAPGEKTEAGEGGPVVPEYCLLRLADVTIEPGKFYRYRLKIRMANPNYGRSDVASVTYKSEKELKSEKWFDLGLTVSTPTDMVYYVVDQKHLSKDVKAEKPVKGNVMFDIWNREPDPHRQVAFQFHRWVESSPIIPDGDPVPVGEWAVADRVFVGRGEYVGRPVKVDLPVWKYTQDSFVLPAEDQKKKVRGKVPTGVTVNFGQDNPDNETILVDFEGGKQYHEETPPGEGAKPIKASDESAYEVLMMTADGRMLARNSADDIKDEKRTGRRDDVRKRIEEVRAGKSGGRGPGGGSGLDK